MQVAWLLVIISSVLSAAQLIRSVLSGDKDDRLIRSTLSVAKNDQLIRSILSVAKSDRLTISVINGMSVVWLLQLLSVQFCQWLG